MQTFSDVSLTQFELEKEKLMALDFVKPEKLPKEAQQLLDIVEKFKIEAHYDRLIYLSEFNYKHETSKLLNLCHVFYIHL